MREGGEGREQFIAVFERDQEVGLVALAIVVEPGIAGGGGQLRKAEIGCQLKRQQLVGNLVRFFDTFGQFVFPGLERVAPAGALAAIDFGLLVIIGRRPIEPLSWFPARSEAAGNGPLAIRIRDAAQIGRNISRVRKVRVRIRYTDFLHDVWIVDETGIVFVVDRATDRKVWRKRLVEGQAGFIAERCCFGIF